MATCFHSLYRVVLSCVFCLLGVASDGPWRRHRAGKLALGQPGAVSSSSFVACVLRCARGCRTSNMCDLRRLRRTS